MDNKKSSNLRSTEEIKEMTRLEDEALDNLKEKHGLDIKSVKAMQPWDEFSDNLIEVKSKKEDPAQDSLNQTRSDREFK